VSGAWDKFLNGIGTILGDPEISSALLSGGLSLLQPSRGGLKDNLIRAVETGGSAIATRREREAEEDQQALENAQKVRALEQTDRRLDLTETGLDIGVTEGALDRAAREDVAGIRLLGASQKETRVARRAREKEDRKPVNALDTITNIQDTIPMSEFKIRQLKEPGRHLNMSAGGFTGNREAIISIEANKAEGVKRKTPFPVTFQRAYNTQDGISVFEAEKQHDLVMSTDPSAINKTIDLHAKGLQTIATAGRLVEALDTEGGAIALTAGGSVANFLNNLSFDLAGIGVALGMPALDIFGVEEKFKGNFGRFEKGTPQEELSNPTLAMKNQIIRTLIIQLGYSIASTNEPGARALTDQDIARAMQLAGDNTDDAAIVRILMGQIVRNTNSAYKTRMRAVNGKTPLSLTTQNKLDQLDEIIALSQKNEDGIPLALLEGFDFPPEFVASLQGDKEAQRAVRIRHRNLLDKFTISSRGAK